MARSSEEKLAERGRSEGCSGCWGTSEETASVGPGMSEMETKGSACKGETLENKQNDTSERSSSSRETPQDEVSISLAFWMMRWKGSRGSLALFPRKKAWEMRELALTSSKKPSWPLRNSMRSCAGSEREELRSRPETNRTSGDFEEVEDDDDEVEDDCADGRGSECA